MRILHYALGFPPYRTGGLTKYCIDLMLTQKENGDEVALLWPGQIGIINRKIKIQQRTSWKGIYNYEIINPLPVALDEGIIDVEIYMKSQDPTVYKLFLEKYKPQVIHMHTLMGIHKEFIDIAVACGIRVVFTSHDYYGLCPKVTFFHNNKICDYDYECKSCAKCNITALDLKKIIIMQSSVYRLLNNSFLIKKIRYIHRQKYFKQEITSTNNTNFIVNRNREYQRLRNYYISMLEEIDIIHFNSTIAEGIYRQYVNPNASKVISISHRDIADYRCYRNTTYDKNNIRFTYLGPAKPYKGFSFLLAVLDKLWLEGKRFELHIYFRFNEVRPYITYSQDGYNYTQLKQIFGETDCLIVPSLWKETFGFTVLEGTSYGVPVIVSKNVGAQDILPKEYVYNDLKDKLTQIINEGIEFKVSEKLLEVLDMQIHANNVKEKLYCAYE